MKSFRREHYQILLVAFTAAVAAASCSSTPTSDSPRPSSASGTSVPPHQFPYPKAKFSTDIAIPVIEQDAAAAQIALDVQVLKITHIGNKDNSALPEINRLVGPFGAALPYDGGPRLSETGGALYRAVDISKQNDSRWEVTTCRYDTPGVYVLGDNGQLSLLDGPHEYHALRSTVELTTERSAAGETATAPRLLVVRSSGEDFYHHPGRSNDLERQTCEPFRPDPYIQQPPQPLSPGK